MRKIIIVLAFLGFAVPAFNQTPEDSVKKVIKNMCKAMKSSDASALLECFTANAVLQTIQQDKEGKISVKSEDVAGFAKQVGSLEKGSADERITFEMVKVDAELASVWTPYRFYYKRNFIHCGVNSFQLVRINSEWKILNIIDTRRRENCRPDH